MIPSQSVSSLIPLLAPLATIKPSYLFGNDHAGVQPVKLMKMCRTQIKLMAFMMTTINISPNDVRNVPMNLQACAQHADAVFTRPYGSSIWRDSLLRGLFHR